MHRSRLSTFLPVFAIAFSLSATLARAQSAEGWWQTVDDKTGRVKSIVHIQAEKEGLSGKVEQLFRKPDEIQHPLCIDCEGARKDQPVLGMTIMWGMQPVKQGWEKGQILDPGNGKIYKCKMELAPGGQALVVRGFIGISLLGRSQTWKRVPAGSEPKQQAAAK